MADLDVSCVAASDGWICQVVVSEHGTESRHSVTLTGTDFEHLAGSDETAESLVRRSFEFLLARESKESILRAFDLPVIGRYFREYEREIRYRPRA